MPARSALSTAVLALLVSTAGLARVASAQSSPDVPIGHPVYDLLESLDASGLVESRISSQRPLSRAEVGRLLLEALDNSEFRQVGSALRARLSRAVEWFQVEVDAEKGAERDAVESYGKPLESASWRVASLSGPRLPDREQGRIFVTDTQVFARLEAHAAYGILSGALEPEGRYYLDEYEGDDGPKARGRLVTGYARLSLLGLDLTVGQLQPDWGPAAPAGGDGLVFTPNAAPVRMISLRTAGAHLLPWVFSALGPVSWEVFVGQLERDRDIERPLLGGIRVSARPFPFLEGGLTRGFLFGGEDRPVNIGLMLTGLHDNPKGTSRDLSDQLAGGDLRARVLLPWGIGVAGYVEGFGEDEAGGLPSKWSVRGGLHVSGLPPAGGVEIRGEWTRTHRSAYQHGLYTDGWTYRGVGIGHHVGPGADDLSAEVAIAPWFWPEIRLRAWISHEIRGKRNRPGFPGERTIEWGCGATWEGPEGLRVTLGGYAVDVRRVGGVPGTEDDGAFLEARVEYRF
ncbi:MAG: capsule assembly Wzi family protein [Planctomycetales bacterium]|nr:capsule assembly Wzi family protein [Planctomycetales bacterium]